MSALILLGEPITSADPKSDTVAPLGQFNLCQTIRRSINPMSVAENLQKEYMAVAHALYAMNIDYRIVYAHPKEVDNKILSTCIEFLGSKLVQIPPVSGSLTSFPRDLGFDLPNICLLSPSFGELVPGIKKEKEAVVSLYGEGGRVLFRRDTVLIAEKISCGGFSKPSQPVFFTKQGLRVGTIPNPMAKSQSAKDGLIEYFTNDHLDRIACLIEDGANGLHLIIDPRYQAGPRECPASSVESLAKVQKVCDDLQIQMHVPSALQIPYSLNLIQFEDGRILMTRGEPSVEAIVHEIVGKENLFLTEIPIRHFPAWTYAGIRCLIGEAPSIFFKPIKKE